MNTYDDWSFNQQAQTPSIIFDRHIYTLHTLIRAWLIVPYARDAEEITPQSQ